MSANLLPAAWLRGFVVVAHPDNESFGLGAVATFVESGCEVGVLCLARREASTLHGVAGNRGLYRNG